MVFERHSFLSTFFSLLFGTTPALNHYDLLSFQVDDISVAFRVSFIFSPACLAAVYFSRFFVVRFDADVCFRNEGFYLFCCAQLGALECLSLDFFQCY